tara:strand:- start:164 stop:520 length:357 start_codon:yes stop_codon:yes gene_type:complete
MKLLGLALLLLSATSAAAVPVTPSFTTGTVTSHTETTTTINESIRQTDYHSGYSYTVSGSNINIPANPGQGANYTMVEQGAAFQFSETYFGPGISSYTEIDRTMTIMSVTDSISAFSQ